MKPNKIRRSLTGFSMIAVMGVSLFSAGTNVLNVKAAEAEETVATTEVATEATTEEMLDAEDASTTSEEAVEEEVAEETRVEAGAEIAINETSFPDGTFREYVKQFDTDNNGIFSSTELQAVKEIDVNGGYFTNSGSIVSLKGIEYFTALEYLDCHGNGLTSLDVSKNTALTRLFCSSNRFTSLDVSNNIALTELDCDSSLLTSLDVSKNTALTKLSCDCTGITSLDVSNNIALTELSCIDGCLTSLNVSGCTALTELYCGRNPLTSLDVSGCIALTKLSCSETALIRSDCYSTGITSLDVSGCTALTELSCSNNDLASLDVSKNTALERLDCSSNQLTSLDVSKNTALAYLECGNNQLTSLDVSKNTALDFLECGNNQLTGLDVSNNTELYTLYCANNSIESRTLDISNNKKLSQFDCDSDALISIDACKDIKWQTSLYAPLYKKDNNYYYDLSKSSLDNTKISSPEIGTYDSASGHLIVPEDMSVQDAVWGFYKNNSIVYDFGSEKKKITLRISEVINLDSYAEYQGYSFFEGRHGDKYCLDSNGNRVINEFKCDGTYTYYFQTDGTAMRDRLTYHPDGVHVIYFDEEGHEVFSNFHKIKTTIEGNAVDDLCFFDVYGHLYVDVMTYGNAAFGNGDKIYYINPYGVIERNGWFGFSETCVWAGTDKKVGMGIGYANADGSLMINQNTYYNGNLVYMQGDGHMK